MDQVMECVAFSLHRLAAKKKKKKKGREGGIQIYSLVLSAPHSEMNQPSNASNQPCRWDPFFGPPVRFEDGGSAWKNEPAQPSNLSNPIKSSFLASVANTHDPTE